ncbi:Alpha/Beta hydrolase protein [Armillaria novae-zelandiae]|uniref:Alpha/Beta hydrolase protein n=1 Tax=Armillaria novae-zelandiae TaxID=153914 RepID=A0AA39NTW4_9AGAR|nr:Alpha/Beta hydrolase protein [Armillaria novae-zelandiae]
MPSSLTNYLQWTQLHNLPATIDELPDGAHLLWIGPKRVDQVILYCHGGAYMMSCTGNVMTFCKYLQVELEQRNIHVGIAILAYKLLPDNPFPAQLHEAQAAIATLLNLGAKPQNITLAGASAGGNLVLQLLTHILHPFPSVSPITPEVNFRGVFLMSPWVSMQEDLNLPQNLLDAKHQYDSLSSQYGRLACRTLLKDVTPAHIPFVDPLEAPEDQFDGLSKLAERVFVMWGGVECLRVGQRRLWENYLEPYHPQVEVYEQVSGIHCQPIWDSSWMGNVGEPKIVEWFARVYGMSDKEELG